ncbi:transmembrane protein [Tieghemostelium lacteum]|uniref:Glycerophosphocholine acyltransferase 1 n=1 Tax=Tieghemostelium lacteum TaxID=361077 RepID=A0A152A4A4_TIELA|nr:transmembrane protein [Tieghemostelium lacteum]|eukprot:KYR01088.1 transmembrane protein [Tieghemostelium lacteum]
MIERKEYSDFSSEDSDVFDSEEEEEEDEEIIHTLRKTRMSKNFSISSPPTGADIQGHLKSQETSPEFSERNDSNKNGSNGNGISSLSDYEEDEASTTRGKPILNNLFQKFLNREIIKKLQQRQSYINSRLEKLKNVVDPNKIRGQSLKREKERIQEVIKLKKKQLNDQMNAPPFIRLMDKCAFTIGLIVLFISEFILLRSPNLFYQWYTLLIVPLMAFRFIMYHRAKYHYFMLDFCYLCQVLLLFYLFGHTYVLGTNVTANLFKLVFALCNGPLLAGCLVWRNSLVFHDVDKLTSVFIHLCPPIVTYCLRWYPQSPYSEELACGGSECSYTLKEAYFIPILLYIFWQVFYYVKTEVVDQSKLANDKDIMTSLRWMSIKQPHPVYKYLVKKGFTVSPLVILMLVQLLYTLGTLLAVPIIIRSFYLHTGLLIFVFVAVSWNGSSFYFEVFSENYSKRLLKEAAEKASRSSSPTNTPSDSSNTSPGSDSSNSSTSSSSSSSKTHRLKITSIYSFLKFLVIFLVSLSFYLKLILSI